MVSDRSNGIYRGVFIAIVGLILIGAGEPPKAEHQSNPPKEASPIYQGGNAAQSTLHVFEESLQSKQPCPKGQDNRNSDLCAQWKAADAAADAVQVSWYQFFLGGAGLVVGFLTLIAAAAAAIYARNAANYTKRSAESYRAREQAHLVGNFDFFGDSARCYFKNIGVSQAVVHIGRAKIFSELPVRPIPINFSNSPKFDPIVVSAGEDCELEHFPIDENNQTGFYIAVVMYQTIFDTYDISVLAVRWDSGSEFAESVEVDWSEWKKEAKKRSAQ